MLIIHSTNYIYLKLILALSSQNSVFCASTCVIVNSKVIVGEQQNHSHPGWFLLKFGTPSQVENGLHPKFVEVATPISAVKGCTLSSFTPHKRTHTLSRIKAHIKNSYLLPCDMSFVQTRTNNQPKTHSRTISDAHKAHYYKLVFRSTAMCFHSPLRDGCLVIWMCCAALEARPSFVSGSHWVSYCVCPLFWPLAALARPDMRVIITSSP